MISSCNADLKLQQGVNNFLADSFSTVSSRYTEDGSDEGGQVS